MKRELLELGAIGDQSTWGHNEQLNNLNNATQKAAFVPKERRLPIKGSNIKFLQRENTITSPLDGFELKCNKQTSSSVVPPSRPELSRAITATPIVESKHKAKSPDDESFMSAALRRAATSSRNVRIYQSGELENLYKELLHQRSTGYTTTRMTKRSLSPIGSSLPSRKSTPVKPGKVSVLTIERPSPKRNNVIQTKLRIPCSYQSAHRPRSTLGSLSSQSSQSTRSHFLTRQKTFQDKRDFEKRCLQINGTSKSVHFKQ